VIAVKDKKDKVYKTNVAGSGFSQEIERDIQENVEKFRDPVILGEMIYKLLEERENTNRILKNLLIKIERLEKQQASPVEEVEEPLLPEVDAKILEFVQEAGKVTAEEVRNKFKYKGKNAASARLNRLYELGLLRKKQVGKKVYFFP